MHALLRSSLVVAMSIAFLVATTPVMAASTSKVTFTLTIRGHLAPDIGFDLTPFPSVGGIPFCVPAANPLGLDVPICRSGRTYSAAISVGRGESIDYEITLYHPTSARALWSGTLMGDGRNHRRDYVIDFDLPATDAAAPARASSGFPAAALPIVVVAWLAGLGAWSAAVHRRRLSVRP